MENGDGVDETHSMALKVGTDGMSQSEIEERDLGGDHVTENGANAVMDNQVNVLLDCQENASETEPSTSVITEMVAIDSGTKSDSSAIVTAFDNEGISQAKTEEERVSNSVNEERDLGGDHVMENGANAVMDNQVNALLDCQENASETEPSTSVITEMVAIDSGTKSDSSAILTAFDDEGISQAKTEEERVSDSVNEEKDLGGDHVMENGANAVMDNQVNALLDCQENASETKPSTSVITEMVAIDSGTKSDSSAMVTAFDDEGVSQAKTEEERVSASVNESEVLENGTNALVENEANVIGTKLSTTVGESSLDNDAKNETNAINSETNSNSLNQIKVGDDGISQSDTEERVIVGVHGVEVTENGGNALLDTEENPSETELSTSVASSSQENDVKNDSVVIDSGTGSNSSDQPTKVGNDGALSPETGDRVGGVHGVEVVENGASTLVDNEANALESKPSSSVAASPVNDVKNETIVIDSRSKSKSSDQLPSSDSAVCDRLAAANVRAVEGGKREETQNKQSSKETAKPAQSTVSSSEKSANPAVPPSRPAGLGPAAPLLPPAPRVTHQPRANGQLSQVQSTVAEDSNNGEVEEVDEIREKLQMIRVKFLRLAHRLGQTPHNVVVAQVLYRLGLAEQLRSSNGGRVGAFSFDRASAMAEQLEASAQEPLDFYCTIMVLGKTGVGKSATINSIFDEVKFSTDAFQMGTKKVQDVVGTVQGIKVRVIDTPGLLSSCSDQRQNEKILNSVKRFIKKSPPDIVLYLDRLDMPSRDFADMPLLKTITEIFGPSIWFNAIVVLTHAASAPPEGPNGTASTYDMFVTQRSHAVQQAIRQAAGDMRLMNPVSLVENHSACRTNRAGQRVLPNGQVWKPHLLLLSFASKILAEANTLLKLQDTPPGKPFAPRSRSLPLPFLLSSLLQSRPQLKLPDEQFGDDDAMEDDLDESSESDNESEYDELPPFKPLTKAQLENLSKAQRKAYYDEMEYREKLLMKKQMKEEKRRRRMMKKMADAAKDMPGEYAENVEEESGGAASIPVPMPDLALPASFDSDNPTHRYRYLDTANQWLVRPVVDNQGWDHDVGYEGLNVERMFVVKEKVPLSVSGQVSKDKKEANLQMEVASSIKHGEGKATTLAFDMQSVGKDMAYTLRSETRFSNYRHNKATAGLSASVLGDSLSAGLKIEDKIIFNKQFKVVMSGGAMASRSDVAYGGSFEATLRDKDYPLGRFLSTLGLSIMDWHGELAIGCNVQSQIPVGRFTNLVARANLNNRGSGQVSLRMNSSEQVQLALIGLIPLLRKLIGESQEYRFGQ